MFRARLVLFGFICSCLYGVVISAQVPPSERSALIALYNATDGDGWVHNEGWLDQDVPECQWYGVECTEEEPYRVRRLVLFDNGLDGTIPAQIADLPMLEHLVLNGNRLSGGIPQVIGSLKSLQYLALEANQLTGPIPAALGSLPMLDRLQLTANQLTGVIPSQLGALSSLRTLNLGNNMLTGPIPPELGQLSQLEELDLAGNPLSGSIPEQLGGLKRLRLLGLNEDHLTGSIPSEIGGLSSLRLLDLGKNDLTGFIPSTMGNLTELEYLDLRENRLEGPIPPELGQLAHLDEAWLNSNRLTGPIPPELGELGSLRYLYLDANNLSGPIPPELGRMASLERLFLGGNQLSGEIPPELGQLASLELLALDSNDLTGEIPAALGDLSGVQDMGLGPNHLTGPIPPELGDLTSLQALGLAGNDLSGEVPAELMQLQQLRTGEDGLDLRWNRLWSDDETLVDFLNAHFEPTDFGSQQTVPPADLTTTPMAADSVILEWSTIPYNIQPGGYRVYTASDPDGPFAFFGETEDKFARWMVVDGLEPGRTHYFQMRTVTYPHGYNPNTLLSEPSEVVSGAGATLEGHGSIRMSYSVHDAVEGETKEIAVWRFGGIGGDVSVRYETGAGSATEGEDYLPASGTLTWADGEGGPRVIEVQVLDDDEAEGEETFDVQLSEPEGSVGFPGPTAANVTITDNDLEAGKQAGVSSDGSRAVLAVGPDGERVAAWAERSSASGLWRVAAQRYDDAGLSEGPLMEVSRSNQEQHSVAAAVGPDGVIAVAWLRGPSRDGGASAGQRLLVRAFAADGAPLSDGVELAAGDVGPPGLAAWDDGFLVVVAEPPGPVAKVGLAQEGNGLVGYLVGPDGEPDQQRVVIDDGASGDAGNPAVDSDGGTRAVVAWARRSSAGDLDVIAKTVAGASAHLGSEIAASGDRAGDQGAPAVAMAADGSFAVAWEGPSLPAADGSVENGIDVYARLFAFQGVEAGEEVRVNDLLAGVQTRPKVAMSAPDKVFVGWLNDDGDGDTEVSGRLVRWGSLDWGKRAGLDLRLDVPGSGVDLRAPDLSFANDGDVTVVYGHEDAVEGDGGIAGNVVSASLPTGCDPNGLMLCLNQQRFQVEVEWADFSGNRGNGLAVPMTTDTGTFWFFDRANVELMVKVLDGTAINGHYWVFYGALSNVEYTLTIRDSLTGSWASYHNPSGNFASYADVSALPATVRKAGRAVEVPPRSVSPETARLYGRLVRQLRDRPAPAADGACAPDATTLCLNGGRFAVQVDWGTEDGRKGEGRAESLTTDTGTFWFFKPSNLELVVKVLDGTGVNGRYWVFYGALSDVEYTLEVTDTATGEVRSYHNPQGTLASVGDTDAFAAP